MSESSPALQLRKCVLLLKSINVFLTYNQDECQVLLLKLYIHKMLESSPALQLRKCVILLKACTNTEMHIAFCTKIHCFFVFTLVSRSFLVAKNTPCTL